MQRPRRAEYTPIDFQTFKEAGSLDITPKFQRRGVWNSAQRSYFIDSLLREIPVPPLYLRETQSMDYSRMVRQVVDGQQRLRTVLDFIDDGFAISKTMPADWRGKRFSRLTPDQQDRVRNYHFSCEIFVNISDAEVLDIFARMNTYSVQLNAQELRNGRYFGHFKQSCYSLAHEYIEFWRKAKLFTEQSIARMQEVELTSELLIQGINGPQDKKRIIDRYYADMDEDFPDRERHERRFRQTMDEIDESVGDAIRDTNFRRAPLFYTLYGAVFHYRFGLPGAGATAPIRSLNKTAKSELRDTVLKLSQYVDAGRSEDAVVPKKYDRFVTACLRQTDNIQPRRIRLTTVLTEWQNIAI